MQGNGNGVIPQLVGDVSSNYGSDGRLKIYSRGAEQRINKRNRRDAKGLGIMIVLAIPIGRAGW